MVPTDDQPTRVLVADDDMELTRVLRRAFERRGFAVLESYDGREALKMVAKERPNVVILDVMMPFMNGWEVCRAIRSDETLNATKVIMLTGIGPNLNEMTSPLYGADAYFDKPVDAQVLIQAVDDLLRERLR